MEIIWRERTPLLDNFVPALEELLCRQEVSLEMPASQLGLAHDLVVLLGQLQKSRGYALEVRMPDGRDIQDSFGANPYRIFVEVNNNLKPAKPADFVWTANLTTPGKSGAVSAVCVQTGNRRGWPPVEGLRRKLSLGRPAEGLALGLNCGGTSPLCLNIFYYAHEKARQVTGTKIALPVASAGERSLSGELHALLQQPAYWFAVSQRCTQAITLLAENKSLLDLVKNENYIKPTARRMGKYMPYVLAKFFGVDTNKILELCGCPGDYAGLFFSKWLASCTYVAFYQGRELCEVLNKLVIEEDSSQLVDRGFSREDARRIINKARDIILDYHGYINRLDLESLQRFGRVHK